MSPAVLPYQTKKQIDQENHRLTRAGQVRLLPQAKELFDHEYVCRLRARVTCVPRISYGGIFLEGRTVWNTS